LREGLNGDGYETGEKNLSDGDHDY
jgi:hypothetical protein